MLGMEARAESAFKAPSEYKKACVLFRGIGRACHGMSSLSTPRETGGYRVEPFFAIRGRRRHFCATVFSFFVYVAEIHGFSFRCTRRLALRVLARSSGASQLADLLLPLFLAPLPRDFVQGRPFRRDTAPTDAIRIRMRANAKYTLPWPVEL